MKTVPAADYIAAMGRHVSSVCVITMAHDGQRHGLTATAVVSITADPPRLMVAINKKGQSHQFISEAKAFCVNVLGENQQNVAQAFSGAPGHEANRFAEGEWRTLVTGAPALKHAVANFDCVLAQTMEQSTHTLFFGDVVGVEFEPVQNPLLYGNRHYRHLKKASSGEDLVLEQISY